MTADFLLELRCEEIPARMQAGARNDLARLFAEELEKAGLSSEGIDVWSTPRRLALIARGLPPGTLPIHDELRGPPVTASKDALDGFLRKAGVGQEALFTKADAKGRETYFAHIHHPARSMAEILTEAIPRIILNFPWPKSMRWGEASASTESLRWVRPLHGIVAMLGEDIVPVSIGGIESGATTLGHRFHHPGPITIGGPGDYAEKLRACHVIIDQEERERIIREGAAQAAKAGGFTLVEDEGLVVENAGLTSWPVPLLGKFDADYLDVPREVIVLTMRTNQKYFACTGEDGGLAPAFVCVANVEAKDGGEAIAQGNARVLAARLADARFFWEQDLKEPLEHNAAKLSGIVFHEKLGTVADKVERVAKLARWLVEQEIVNGAKADQVERAARLAKADLVSGMVGEFPELQGVIGGYLAEAQGEPKAVAQAIRDHYGISPNNEIGLAVALADKLDDVISFFGVNEKPTGSRDPFALRRAGLGAMFLILGRSLRLDLTRIAPRDVIDFLIDRWKHQTRSAGGRPDLIDAVVTVTQDGDLSRLGERMRALEAFVASTEGADLLTAYKRAANILKKEKWGEGSQAPDQVRGDEFEPQEAALVKALDAAEPKATAAVEKEDFTAAMAALAILRSPIDAFFDHVTVNDPDKAKRARRLDLLMRFRDAVHRVADFSRIEG